MGYLLGYGGLDKEFGGKKQSSSSYKLGDKKDESYCLLSPSGYQRGYGEVGEVSTTISKVETATGDFLSGHFDTKKFQRINVPGNDNDRGCRRTPLLQWDTWRRRVPERTLRHCPGK